MFRPTRKTAPEKSGKATQAAAYVRMSTEHQQYSTGNQLDMIRVFAESRGLEIVRVYTDEGKSGLRLSGRNGLKALLGDVESGNSDFSFVLVYDVSRWGRFQDPDESASYEIRCKQSGCKVLYCAEQFENDGSPVAAIIKSVKRTMAGEYSRELSVKVHAGQCRLIRNGKRQGGPAGFGLRRALIDQAGVQQRELGRGEHKSLQTDRVILVPGPQDEVCVVRGIYQQFVEEGRTELEIASFLNAKGIGTDRGTPWTRGTIHQILINEKYIGHNVWNRTSLKLKQQRVRNRLEDWVRADNAFEAIVDPMFFEAARQIIMARSYRLSDDQMLDTLRWLLLKKGYLSGIVIDEETACPSSSAYVHRFGSLLRTYDLIGYNPNRDYRYLEINRRLRELHPGVVEQAIQAMRNAGATVEADDTPGLLRVNDEFSISLVLSRCRPTPAGSNRWVIRFDSALRPDLTVAARMEFDGKAIRDYYLFPAIDLQSTFVRLQDHNDFGFEAFRFNDLDVLCYLARRAPLKGVAYE